MANTAKSHAPYRETRRLKAHERSALILAAAQETLIREGYSGLTLRNVADRAGIRLATLQYYFSTRAALFEATFEQAVEGAWTGVTALVDEAGTTPENRLHAMLTGLYKTTRDDPLTDLFFELWSRARLDEFAAELMDSFYAEIVSLLANLIGECRSDLSRAETKRRSTLIVATLEGMTLFSAMDGRAGRRPVVPARQAVATLSMISMA